jgi:hypothetical protein
LFRLLARDIHLITTQKSQQGDETFSLRRRRIVFFPALDDLARAHTKTSQTVLVIYRVYHRQDINFQLRGDSVMTCNIFPSPLPRNEITELLREGSRDKVSKRASARSIFKAPKAISCSAFLLLFVMTQLKIVNCHLIQALNHVPSVNWLL